MVSSRLANYQAYTQATYTVGKTRQIVMLYDAAVRFMRQARDAVAEQRIEDRFKYITKAQNIINGLQASIDFANGGAIATTLYDFYASISGKLLAIQRRNDVALCDEVIRELQDMHDVWDAIDKSFASSGATSADTKMTPVGASDAGGHVTMSA